MTDRPKFVHFAQKLFTMLESFVQNVENYFVRLYKFTLFFVQSDESKNFCANCTKSINIVVWIDEGIRQNR